jgi:putative ABC transport system ATP-binding protein
VKSLVYQLRDVEIVRSKGGVSFTLQIPALQVPHGSFFAIVGESGCGKSTLLDLLGLVLPPTKAKCFDLNSRDGEVFPIMEETSSSLSRIRRAHLGYVLQSGGLMPFLTVAQNILLARMLNPARALSLDSMEDLVFRLGIEEQLEKKPSQLSGGQRQRAAIARALAQNPEIILADEPTGAVDRFTGEKIRDLFLKCARERGISVLLVTHDLPLVEGSADAMFTFELQRVNEGRLVSTLRPR